MSLANHFCPFGDIRDNPTFHEINDVREVTTGLDCDSLIFAPPIMCCYETRAEKLTPIY